MRTTLPQLNQVDPGLENRINLLFATVERTVAAHLDEPGEGLADDLEGLRSATRRLRVPTEEPGLGETYALRELGAAQGRMLNAVLDAQEEARDQGFRPMASSVERDLGIDIPRAGNEDVLRDIAARLDEVVERLDQLEHARAEGSDFRAEGRLLDFYIGKMRVQVDLARLQLRIGERTVDFSALWRATQSMSELTQGFVATVKAWLGRVSTTVTQLATGMGQRVRGVADGMRVAVRTILRRRQGRADVDPPVPPRSQPPNAPPGFDIDVVKAMILQGEDPPVAWRPFITALDFAPADGIRGRTELSDLRPLAALTALQSLNLTYTLVRDVTPLGALTVLQSLDLTGTRVSDVRPLGALTALKSLNLRRTQVSDVRPLGALTALQALDLRNTPVSDVRPLGALTALRSLDLTNTQVRDVRPLSALTALQILNLAGTWVSDVRPLGLLTALRSLDLSRTQVHDVTPLASLKVLRSLDLTGIKPTGLDALRGPGLDIIQRDELRRP